MAAQKQTLDEIDDTKGTLMDTMYDVQTTMAKLHTQVGDLLDSMAEMLKSMSEMKETVLLQQSSQITTNQNLPESSQITVNQSLPESSPVKQSINDEDEKKEPVYESRYTHLKKIQIEMPTFEGSNVNLWISRAERYFEIGDFTEPEKMKLVYLSVDGEALFWYNFWKVREPFVDWVDFKSRLLERFGDFELGSVLGQLMKLKQVESVRDYLRQFEELASQLTTDDITSNDSLYEAVFMNGLKEEIRGMLPLFQPKGIVGMMDLARRLENSPFCRVLIDPPLETGDIDKS